MYKFAILGYLRSG